MSDDTGISWTNATWNPIRGCTRVSEGCRHCYAERVAARFSGPGQPYEGLVTRKLRVISDDEQRVEARWTGDVRFVAEHLADPLRWRRPRRIFVNSMSDLFHERLTNEQIAAVFGVMAAAGHHSFQVLTKRAARMREWFAWAGDDGLVWSRLVEAIRKTHRPRSLVERLVTTSLDSRLLAWPLPNVWLGVSAENQAAADERIPDLLATPAAVRWVSAEPLLGPLDFRPPGSLGYLRNVHRGDLNTYGAEIIVDRPGLDWVVAGCESGPGARPADVEWFRELRDQCATAGVAFFFKQAARRFGEWTDWKDVIGPGPGSKQKTRDVIELPYLDGVQHAAFPEVTP
jgi:protein gp37